MVRENRFDRQRGAGRLGSLITTGIFLAFLYAAWNVAPVYMADFSLGDKMLEICRLSKGMNPDERISDLLMGVVRDQRLEDYIKKSDFTINTRESSRRISVAYDRTVKVLPGWKRTFKFSHDVDQPFF